MSIEREVKIMGLPLRMIIEEADELKVDSIISLANEKYIEAGRKNSNIVDSSRLRAIAIFNIVKELQAIKGEKENIEEKSSKRINELIDMVDSLNLPI